MTAQATYLDVAVSYCCLTGEACQDNNARDRLCLPKKKKNNKEFLMKTLRSWLGVKHQVSICLIKSEVGEGRGESPSVPAEARKAARRDTKAQTWRANRQSCSVTFSISNSLKICFVVLNASESSLHIKKKKKTTVTSATTLMNRPILL